MPEQRPVPEPHAERIELSRAANGRYYWKLVVLGDIDAAATRACAADELLRRHFGHRAPDPTEGGE